MKKVKLDNDNIELQFKKMIKDAILEEGYFKEKNIKLLMTDILKVVDEYIAERVKQHFYEIGKSIMLLNKIEEKDLSKQEKNNKKQKEENKNA